MGEIEQNVALKRATDLTLVLNTPKGRGVFANRNISKGTIIDVCPVLVLEKDEDIERISRTVLNHYTYNWPLKVATGQTKIAQAVVFGLGSMFNHKTNQNIGWERNTGCLLITYTAIQDIEAGEELCISYGQRLTFQDADTAEPYPDEDGSDMLNNIQLF